MRSPSRARAVRRASPRAARRCACRPWRVTRRLSYEVKANVGGKLAQIGSRLVDAAAKKVADDFFRNFNENFASAAPGDPGPPGVSDTALRFLAAGALVVFVISMYFFLT